MPPARPSPTRVDSPQADPQRVALALRVLNGDLAAAHLWFNARVLERYRGQADPEAPAALSGFRVLRTNTVGRLQAPDRGWSLDFGIAPGEEHIHAPLGDLAQRLPATERQHWAQHVSPEPPASGPFLSMRLAPGSCIDDGDLREWAGNED